MNTSYELFLLPVPSRVQIQNPARLKSTQNKKSTKNKEAHKSKQLTWGLILFLLPVALLNKDFFSPTLFSFALYRFKGMDYSEQLFLTHSFCPSIGSQYTMLIGLGQAGSGCRVRSGQVQSGPVRSGLVFPVRSGPVQSGPVQSGPVRSGPVRSGPVRSGPVRSGQVESGSVQLGHWVVGLGWVGSSGPVMSWV
jgi:hypothetical protein